MKIHDLSLTIDGKELLKDLHFEVPRESIFLILGANGAGKTLLLRCLAGLRPPSRGRIEREAHALAWVPLSQSLPFSFQAIDLIVMGRFAKHKGFPGKKDRIAAEEAAERLGLNSLLSRSYNSLSRGEQTKIDIARAIASEAPLVLLDEPFSNLDIDACLQMIAVFKDLKAQGRTLILSHHDLHSARDLATHGLLLKKGELLAAGAIQDIFQPSWIEKAYNVRPIFAENGALRFESALTPSPVP